MAENENSERDTHFLGFAGMLYDNIYHRIEQEYGPMHSFRPTIRLAVEQIIAQRAYDLVFMSFDESLYFEPHETVITDEQHIKAIQTAIRELPDMTEWPTDPGTSQQIDTPS